MASEVKELAGQTARETQGISGQIGRIQASTSQAVAAIGSITQRIRDISATATSIAAAVEQQGAATQEIVRNVAQAAAGTGEVTGNIAGVARLRRTPVRQRAKCSMRRRNSRASSSPDGGGRALPRHRSSGLTRSLDGPLPPHLRAEVDRQETTQGSHVDNIELLPKAAHRRLSGSFGSGIGGSTPIGVLFVIQRRGDLTARPWLAPPRPPRARRAVRLTVWGWEPASRPSGYFVTIKRLSMQSRDDQPNASRRGLSPLAAALTVGGVLLGCGLISRRYSPDPTHPDIRRWYKRLDKPGFKPPDPVFGAAWPVLNSLQSAGAYRLLRAPAGPERDVAIGLWLLSQALVTTYGKITFGDKSLTGGVVTASALVFACTAFVERAAHVDGVAAGLGVPIAAWSVFGDALTEDLRERNPDLDGREVPERYRKSR